MNTDAESVGTTLPPRDVAVVSTSKGARRSHYLILSLAILVLDLWSKWWIEAHLGMHTTIELIPGFLNFTHVQNTGVAFGLFASHGAAGGSWLLTLLGLAALTFVGYYFRQVPAEDRLLLLALALILGGAVGNLLDRMMSGGVTDFIDVYYRSYHWHTFNVADSAITIGIVLMLLSSIRQPAAESPPETSAE